jgi:hypothetical protein
MPWHIGVLPSRIPSKNSSAISVGVNGRPRVDLDPNLSRGCLDEAEGKISEQVRLMERLGLLERVVQETSSGAKSLFRIPKLYTRCWDHA